MNLKTLAELAGVSVATVSKAFSGSKEISEKTRQKIFALAKEYDCFDRYNKNKFSKKVIAVLVPELRGSYYTSLVSLLYERITAKECVMIASSYDFSDERKAELFHYFASYCKADGILIIGGCRSIRNSTQTPSVALCGARKHPNITVIPSDISGAIQQAILHLKELGHTRIGFAGESLTGGKLLLFKSAMRRAGLPIRCEWIKESPLRFESAGTQMAEEWLKEGTLPTAILAAYDNIAIGLIKALTQRGYHIPEQISIIGMDDISVAPFLETSLSSIGTHTDELCDYAVELLMKKLENPYYSPTELPDLSAIFIPRTSSGPVPNLTT